MSIRSNVGYQGSAAGSIVWKKKNHLAIVRMDEPIQVMGSCYSWYCTRCYPSGDTYYFSSPKSQWVATPLHLEYISLLFRAGRLVV